LGKFNAFISSLDHILGSIDAGREPKKESIKIGIIGTIFPIDQLVEKLKLQAMLRTIFMNNSGYLSYSRVEVAADTRRRG
jgi:hypothetical protein